MFVDYNSLFLLLFFLWVVIHFIKGLFSIYIDYSSISTFGGQSTLGIAFYIYCVCILFLLLNASDVFCHTTTSYLMSTDQFELDHADGDYEILEVCISPFILFYSMLGAIGFGIGCCIGLIMNYFNI